MFAVGFVLFILASLGIKLYTHPFQTQRRDYVFFVMLLVGFVLLLISSFIKFWSMLP